MTARLRRAAAGTLWYLREVMGEIVEKTVASGAEAT